MPNRVRALTILLLASVAAAAFPGCGDAGEEREREPARSAAAEPASAKAGVTHAESAGPAAVRRKESPLPAFSGWTVSGERLGASELLGKRALLAFFDPANAAAEPVLRGLERLARFRGDHNFQLLGVASGTSRAGITAAAERMGLGFPLIDDSSKRIQRKLRVDPSQTTVLLVDEDGYIVWGTAGLPNRGDDAVDRVEVLLREKLRIPDDDAPSPGDRPLAPTFTADVLDSDSDFDLAQHRGQPVLLIFFLHTCPHCHDALTFLKGALGALPEDKRPLLVGLEVSGRTADTRSSLKKEGLDFFPVLFDTTGKVLEAYGVFGGVPDIFLIDAEGRIASRTTGWREEIDAPLLRMRVARQSGAPVPMLLRTDGYTGSEVCGVCHESEHQTWQLTTHAGAFDTLVTHAASADPECVGCHVVGFGQSGGFEISPPTAFLEDVGCESCHGRGGPHLSPGFVTDDDYEPICVTCHDTKHSLGFEYAGFLPEVSHAANAHILTLPEAERRKILAERGALRTDLLPSDSAYVGSEACRSCHAQEFETWHAGPHAGALASLEGRNRTDDADCLRCHTTGFDRNGGFPAGGAAADHADLARVGCESCHGPGANHVAEGSRKLGSIVSLGDKCDSCVILQICGGCHDDANDPGFEFVVQEKIDRIRHGTIEAGTGRPLGESASRPPHTRELLERAFALRDAATWPN